MTLTQRVLEKHAGTHRLRAMAPFLAPEHLHMVVFDSTGVRCVLDEGRTRGFCEARVTGLIVSHRIPNGFNQNQAQGAQLLNSCRSSCVCFVPGDHEALSFM